MALLEIGDCEWCNRSLQGLTRSVYMCTGSEADVYKNEPDKNRKAELWERCCRDGEWAKAGDKRGFFCSSQCRTLAGNNGDYGSWHSRGWIW